MRTQETKGKREEVTSRNDYRGLTQYKSQGRSLWGGEQECIQRLLHLGWRSHDLTQHCNVTSRSHFLVAEACILLPWLSQCILRWTRAKEGGCGPQCNQGATSGHARNAMRRTLFAVPAPLWLSHLVPSTSSIPVWAWTAQPFK